MGRKRNKLRGGPPLKMKGGSGRYGLPKKATLDEVGKDVALAESWGSMRSKGMISGMTLRE